MCCPCVWVFGPNSLNKGPFFGTFSINLVVYPEVDEKFGNFRPKFIIKVGMKASFGN